MNLNAEIHPYIRVLIVDDSAFMRTALARMISRQPDLQVVATARCASDAFEKSAALDPDVVTLDVAMPGLDGLGTLRCIMQQFPRPVIMVSAATEKDAQVTFDALSAGAFDYVPKQMSATSLDITHIRTDLIAKIRAAAAAGGSHWSTTRARKPPRSRAPDTQPSLSAIPAVVAIGVSTGGPKALEQILPRFPRDFPVPILIVQHMPVGFTRPFAQRLDSLCAISVHEAAQRELIQPGVAYIAPAGSHMCVVPRVSDSKPIIALGPHPEDSIHIPSVDVLMKSVSDVFKNRALGVIMTGMGSDGAEGMSAIYRQGGFTLGQDEATCAVYGMPRVCAEIGVLTRVVSLSDIPAQILRATLQRKRA
jgi:two-component system, chemotaxis family, protein-glutamate methylesterase/glutaminase